MKKEKNKNKTKTKTRNGLKFSIKKKKGTEQIEKPLEDDFSSLKCKVQERQYGKFLKFSLEYHRP